MLHEGARSVDTGPKEDYIEDQHRDGDGQNQQPTGGQEAHHARQSTAL